eukprot:5137817-Prorocentrum_lima.AAC.1
MTVCVRVTRKCLGGIRDRPPEEWDMQETTLHVCDGSTVQDVPMTVTGGDAVKHFDRLRRGSVVYLHGVQGGWNSEGRYLVADGCTWWSHAPRAIRERLYDPVMDLPTTTAEDPRLGRICMTDILVHVRAMRTG